METKSIRLFKQLSNKYILSLTIIIMILFTNCNPSKKKVVGKYYAKHNWGVEYVIIRKDNTYLHYFSDKDEVTQHEGNWKFERNRFILYDWITYVMPGEKVIKRRTSIANVYCNGSEIEFWDEYEYNFHKIKDGM